ncbi:MAG: hypothetical protein ACPG19_06245 [Saprospiraceae bacterium]
MKNQIKKVYQTEFEANKGNALQACVASIFGETIENVPNFIESDNYANAISDFVYTNYGLTFVKILLNKDELDFPVQHETWILAAGKSPRGNFKHVVVSKIVDKKITLLHDPYPNANGLLGAPNWIGLFVKAF